MKLYKSFIFTCLVFYAVLILSSSCSHDEHEPGSVGENEQAVEQQEYEGGTDMLVLDAKTKELIGLKTAEAVITSLDEVIQVPGKIINNENEEIHVNTLIPARVHELMANWGEAVKKDQPLVCLESIELGKKRAEYHRAEAELGLALAEYERKERLYEQEAVSEKLLQEAEVKKRSAEINLEYARKMLRLTGLKEEEIFKLSDEDGVIEGCSVRLVSPIDGVVIERNVKRGEQVEPGECLFKILDVSTVWIEADIFEKDLLHAQKGRQIKTRVPAYPDQVFHGAVFCVGSTLDGVTRTVKVRSEVKNKGLLLKPGMYAAVELVTGRKENTVAIPEEAVLSDDNLRIVFVQEGENYHRHQVKIGIRSNGLVEVLSGVSAGDLVVVQGNYQLKSRLLMAATDPHAGHIH